MKLVRVKEVMPLHDFVVQVVFSDDSSREIDLKKYLRGPVFDRVRENPDAFRAVRVTESRTIGWDDDLDIDPDTLYYDLAPAWAEEAELELAK